MKKYIPIAGLITALIVIGLALHSVYLDVRQKIITDAQKQEMILAKQAALGIKNYFHHYYRSLTSLAHELSIQSMTPSGTKRLEDFYRDNSKEIRAITRVSEQGRIIQTVPFNKKVIGADISFQKHVKLIMETHRPTVSDVFKAVQGYWAVAYHVPVMEGNKFKGTLAILIPFDLLSEKYLKTITLRQTGSAWMINRWGVLLYDIHREHIGQQINKLAKVSPSLSAVVTRMMSGEEGTASYLAPSLGSRASGPIKYEASFSRIDLENTYWSVAVAKPEVEILAAIKSFRNKLTLLFLLLAVIGLGFSFYAIKTWATIKEQTKRQLAEDELKASEERFALAMDASRVGLWDWHIDTGEVHYNSHWYTMLGYEPLELPELFETWRNLLHPDDLPGSEKQVREHVESGYPFEIEFRMKAKDGQWKWILARGQTVERNDKGIPVRMIGTHVDITGRQEAERALHQSELQYRLLADNSSDIIWIRDMELNLTYVSPAVERVRGFTPDEALNQKMDEVLMPGSAQKAVEAFKSLMPQAIANGRDEPFTIDLEHRCKDGTGKWLECNLSMLRDAGGQAIGILGVSRDISDRKQAERKLRVSEERYRDISNAQAGIVWEIDADSIVTHVSGRVSQILGYEPEEIVGRSPYFLVDPGDLDRFRAFLTGLEREGRPIKDMEYWCRAKDGRRVRLSTTGIPIFGRDGLFIGARGTHLDITETHLAQHRREVLLRISTMLDAPDEAISDVLCQACAEQTDSPMALFGMLTNDESAITAQAWSPQARAECRIQHKPLRLEIETAGLWAEPVRRRESVIINDLSAAAGAGGLPDGHVPIERYLGIPIIEGGRILALVGVANKESEYDDSDIETLNVIISSVAVFLSERLKERALRESEARYKLTFDAIPDSITITRVKDGRYIYVNDGFCNLSGYSREEAVGGTSLGIDIYVNPGDRLNMMRELREKGLLLNYEVQFQRKDGTVFDSYFSAQPIAIDGEDCLIALAKDVTEFKRAEAEKDKLETHLRQAQKMEALGTLAGGIAHDFNNILAAIMGYSELALDKAETGKGAAGELRHILSSAERARDLVTQILTFSRRVESELKPIDLNKVIYQTEQMLERTIPRMVEIEHHLDKDIRPINADPGQMTQVLMNLCTNANDAMPDGGKLTIRTENATLDAGYSDQHAEVLPGDYVRLTVSDTGHGMDQGTLEHIFDPFFTQKEVGKGTGLGLATVYGIVKNHDGHIICHTELGRGTDFIIYLPALSGAIGPEFARKAVEEDRIEGGTETILLVDDEETIRDLGQQILAQQGYRVITAANGEEALDMYGRSGGDIDLVILDISMPGMGGHKCLQELLHISPRAKVIISSGYSLSGQLSGIMDEGASGFVPKPFRRSEMLKSVREVLER